MSFLRLDIAEDSPVRHHSRTAACKLQKEPSQETEWLPPALSQLETLRLLWLAPCEPRPRFWERRQGFLYKAVPTRCPGYPQGSVLIGSHCHSALPRVLTTAVLFLKVLKVDAPILLLPRARDRVRSQPLLRHPHMALMCVPGERNRIAYFSLFLGII